VSGAPKPINVQGWHLNLHPVAALCGTPMLE
jgi:hypothetical protein